MTYTLAMGNAWATDDVVWLALSDNGSAYAETAEAARREILRGGAVTVEILPWQQLLGGGRAPPRLMIAIGAGAFTGLMDSEVRAPLLATLLPRLTYERHAPARGGRAQSAIFLDQPISRQLELLRLALPERRRVGVLLGPESRSQAPALRRAASERGLMLTSTEASGDDNLFPLLRELIASADLLLAVPDPHIYNSLAIQNILTTTYRARVPLIGFSPAYVKAGALLALYSTPSQIGTQAGELARGVLAGKPLPPPQPPRDFSIGVNADVARSLGIAISSEDSPHWVEQLRLKERAP